MFHWERNYLKKSWETKKEFQFIPDNSFWILEMAEIHVWMGYQKTREQLEDNCQTTVIKMSKLFYLIAVKIGSGLEEKT